MLSQSKNSISLFLALSAAFTLGCDPARHGRPAFRVHTNPKAKSQPKVEANEKTEDSFKIEKRDPTVVTPRPSLPSQTPSVVFKANQADISISREALDKEFLLQGVLIPQDGVAMGKSIKSRVVAFHVRGKQLIMLEATQGHSINSDFSQKLVLATFNVLKQEDNFITFDFNGGMSKLMGLRDWYAKDVEGPGYSSEKQYSAMKVLNSYIDDAQIDDQNQLVIRQISLMNANKKDDDLASIRIPIEVKYYLSPYRPSEGYTPAESPRRFDQMGFFEINPQLSESGATLNYASRFNPDKPIVFAISANTPADYQKAVRDGILYWNKAFGKEIVKAIVAPENVRAPDVHHNVVQWVKYDNAGSAYADGQMDPRTGEILHAQVYLTSAFAFGGKNKARETLRKLSQPETSTARQAFSPYLKGLAKEQWCNLEYKETLTEILETVLREDLEDATILRISQDYVREVVAHEIGHTLGLRHNFAGTLAATYSAAERPQLFKDYIKNGHSQNNITYSSSVMDYHRIEESALIGNLIEESANPLSYDLKAIRKLYFNQDLKLTPDPLFCTDSHADISGFVDCQRFDFGASPLEYAKWKIESGLKDLPLTLVEKYIRNQSDSLTKPYLVEQVPLESTTKLAETLLQPLSDILKLQTVDRALLKIERSFTQVDERTEPQIKRAYDQAIESEIMNVGGIETLITLIPEQFATKVKAQVDGILSNPNFRKGFGYGGRPFSLSDEDVVKIKNDLAVYLDKLETSLIKTELKKLKSTEFSKDPANKNSVFRDNKIGFDLAKAVAKKIDSYVLATTETSTDTEVTKVKSATEKVYEKTPIRLPTFKYSQEIRTMAAGLLNEGRGEDLSWGLEEKANLQLKINKVFEEALTAPLDTIEAAKQNKIVLRWMTENKKVIQSLK